MRFGKLHLSSCAILAPLEGVSDAGFRALCASRGAAFTFVEMLRSSAIARRNAAALALIDPSPPHICPTGLQLLAGSPDELMSSLCALEELAATTHPHFLNLRCIDLNLGCPSPAVISDGRGPALLKRRARLASIFTALARWREGNSLGVAAVGAKLRLGLNSREAALGLAGEAAASAAEVGLDYVTVHGRHAGQGSGEPADWGAIARVVARARQAGRGEEFSVLCNGDVRGKECAAAALAATGADGVMVARAAYRNPAVFEDLKGLRKGGSGSGAAAGAGPPAAARAEWPSGGTWLSEEEVAAAEAAWQGFAAATPGGGREKHAAFHSANFKRLAIAAADSGKRCLPAARVTSQHLA